MACFKQLPLGSRSGVAPGPDSLASNFVEPHLVELNLRLPVGQGGIRHDNAHYNGHWHRLHSTRISATILRLGNLLGTLIHFQIRTHATHAEEDPRRALTSVMAQWGCVPLWPEQSQAPVLMGGLQIRTGPGQAVNCQCMISLSLIPPWPVTELYGYRTSRASAHDPERFVGVGMAHAPSISGRTHSNYVFSSSD